MYQVKLNNYKSYDDLGLKVISDNLSRAEPRQVYQTINGMDGAYNMTNIVHGRTTYAPRTLTVVFQSFAKTEVLYEELCSTLDSLFSGQTIAFIRDCDNEHYLLGEVAFESEHNFHTQTHTLTAMCDPYRYNIEETTESFTVSVSRNITLTNSKKPAQPIFTTTSSGMSVVVGGAEYSIPTNGFTTPEIYLTEGENEMTLKGTGTIEISYLQGVL